MFCIFTVYSKNCWGNFTFYADRRLYLASMNIKLYLNAQANLEEQGSSSCSGGEKITSYNRLEQIPPLQLNVQCFLVHVSWCCIDLTYCVLVLRHPVHLSIQKAFIPYTCQYWSVN